MGDIMENQKPMTKGDILDHLAGKLNITKKMAGEFLTELVELAYSQAKIGFTIPNLGKLSVSERSERKGRNPQTGEEITIAAKKVVKFKVAKACQDSVFPENK